MKKSDLSIACGRVIGQAANICHPERVGAHATASRRTPAPTVPVSAASGNSHETLPNGKILTADALRRGESSKNCGFPDHRITCDHPITRFLHLIRAVLREIFDESAYDRFLRRTSASRSVASYRNFIGERDAAMAKKPRCC
jgi:hypothetical protein